MNDQPKPVPPAQAPNSEKPVAYDSEGRPLYAAPQSAETPPPIAPAAPVAPSVPVAGQPQPQYVHMSRAVEPVEQPISPEVKKRHDESMKAFPFLNLSEAEFVISAVRRHPIGLIIPVGITAFLIAVSASMLINYTIIMQYFGILDAPNPAMVYFIGTLFILLVGIGGYIAVWVYMNNKFFLTNESVIQEIQTSLFSRHEQTVSLINIEDASFQQHGILQTMLNYGSIRLSTEGDETTYRFEYVSNPKDQIATLNNAVEAFKNGRPVLND
jgi:hypothetical protein